MTIGQFASFTEARAKDDFYPTPPEMTRSLLSVEKFDGEIWEPACGDGAMSQVLESEGYAVRSSDLVSRGYGKGGVDFLFGRHDPVANIVTNPPFKLTEQFIDMAIKTAEKKVAMLGRLAMLEGQERRKMWDSTPIARVWVFSKRIACVKPGDADYGTKGGKGGMIAYAWFVWEHGYTGRPQLGWI